MTASSFPVAHEASNYDEDSMQQSLMFSDTLKDLETLRGQLYSAAEYFELSYNDNDQKHILIETLKDYAIKALVNTVDHLGSATYKVNDLLDEKVKEVSATELRISCIEQRLRTCQEHTDREGHTEQSLILRSPKFHKHYILPGNLRATVQGNIYRTLQPTRKGRSPSPVPSPCPLRRHATFSAPSPTPRKELDNRNVSPRRFPLLRSGSTTSRLGTPGSSRPATPNKSRPNHHQYPSEPRRSTSSENSRDTDSRGRGFIRVLFGGRKLKKDDMLYTYLDEY